MDDEKQAEQTLEVCSAFSYNGLISHQMTEQQTHYRVEKRFMKSFTSSIYELIYFKSKRDLEAFENYRKEGGNALAEDFDYPDEGVVMKFESIFIPERDGDLDDFINLDAEPGTTDYILIHRPNNDIEVDEDGEWEVTNYGTGTSTYGEVAK